jgi:exocyst complex component 2
MLVEAHAKIGDIVPSSPTPAGTGAGGLVNRVLIALVTTATEVALRCFQQVPKYGTGGMLTVGLSSLSQTSPHVKSTDKSIGNTRNRILSSISKPLRHPHSQRNPFQDLRYDIPSLQTTEIIR